jgi:hypothetical protein
MKLWVIITLACVVVVVIVLLIVRALVLARRRQSIERRLVTAEAAECAGQGDATIYVSVINDVGNTETGAATVLSLFREAECPLRVHVNVYDVVDTESTGRMATPPAFTAAVLAQAKSAGFPMERLQQCLRVLQVPATLYRGRLPAREQLERFTYKDELYLMTLQPGAVMAPKWDSLIVGMWTALGDPRAILTTRLAVEDAAAGSNGVSPPLPTQPGTFVGFTTAFPALAAYKLRKRTALQDAPPAVAWCSSLSFVGKGRHDAFLIPALPDTAEDVAMWATLVRAGWTAWYHPVGTLAVVRAGTGSGLTASTDVVPYLDPGVMRVLGVHPVTRQPTTRARVGLSASPKTQEIEAKLGSMDDYVSLLSRVELTNI